MRKSLGDFIDQSRKNKRTDGQSSPVAASGDSSYAKGALPYTGAAYPAVRGSLGDVIDSARRGETVHPQSWQDYGGGYTPAPSVPAYSNAQSTAPAVTGAQAAHAPLGAAMSAAVGARIAKAAGPELARQQDDNGLERLRQRAEELEQQYKQLGTSAGQEQLESLYGEKQRTEEWLKQPEDEAERRQLENRLASINEQIAVYEASTGTKNGAERTELAQQSKAAREEYEQAAAKLGLAKPSFGERVLKTLSGAGKQYLGSAWDAAGAVMPNGTAVGEVYQEQLESLYGEKQRTEEWLKQPEDEAERRQLENRLASINAQIAVYEASVRANEGVSDAARDAAAEITQSGAVDIERAKSGAGAAGRLLVDVGAAGAQMAADAALGGLTGFGSMAPMMVRSFGGGAQQAREKGYSQKQQIAMGFASAATEYFSEKLFGGNPVYDSDAGLVSRLVGKVTENETLLNYLASKPAEMLYEGLEEVTADILEPLAEQIIAGQHDDVTLEQIIEDGLVGIILAGGAQGIKSAANTVGQKIGGVLGGRRFSGMGGQSAAAGAGATENAAPGGAAGKYTLKEADAIRHEGKTFKNVIAGIDTTVSDFFSRWKEGRKSHQGEKLEKLYLAKLSEDSIEKVSQILGYEVSERDVIVTNDDVRHIVDRHPDLGQWVFEALPEVVSNPDNISEGHQGSGKNAGKTGVIFEKTLPDGSVIAIQFDNPGRGTMQVTTVYANEKTGNTTLEATAGIPTDAHTPEASKPVFPAEESIAQSGGDVNSNQNAAEDSGGLPESAVESLASRDNGADTAAATNNTARGPAAQTAAQARPVAQQAYDAARIRRAASALGENGAKALTAAYDGSTNAGSFYAGFAAYYEAGMSGMDMGKVQSVYSGQLNEAQRYAAYVSGQNDAAASLSAEREAAKFATAYGKEAGLIRNDNAAKIPRKTAVLYNSLAKATGVKIELVDSIQDADGNAGAANGIYLPGRNTIQIAMDAERPLNVVAAHEVTHRMQELAPEAYRKYRDYAVNALTELAESPTARIEKYKALYAERGTNLTTEQAMDEIAADFTRGMVEDAGLFERLALEDRSVARRVLDALKEFVEKVKRIFKGDTEAQNNAAIERYGADIATLEEAARLWNTAMKAAQKQAKTIGNTENAARTDGAARYSIKYDQNNNPYVVIETDILAGVPRSEWVRTVKDNLRAKFPEGVTLGSNVIQITGKSRGEMTFSKYMQSLMRTAPDLFANKLRATNNTDEILRAARNWVNEALLHPRKDDIIDFARGEVLLSVGGNDYTANVIVGNRGNNGLLLYDIIDLVPAEIPERIRKTDAAYTAAPTKGHHDRQATPDNVILAQDVGDVNLTGKKASDVVKLERGKTKSDAAIVKNPSLGTGRSTASGFKDSIGQSGGKVKGRFSLKAPYAGKSLTDDSSIYSYRFLTELPDMRITTLPEISAIKGVNGKVDTGKAVASGMRNARNAGTERDGKVFVRNAYTGKQLQITGESIRHGLNGGLNRLLTNARLGAVIGNLAQNAVPINALNNKAEGVTGTYAMAAYATDSAGREFVAVLTVEQRTGRVVDMEAYDMLHAVSGRQKRSERADTKSQGLYPSTNASVSSQVSTKLQGVYPSMTAEISIANVLDAVKSTHQSILSEDVLSHLGKEENSSGHYTGQVKFSLKGSSDIQREMAALQKENQALRERVDYWKGQTKRTERVTTDKKAVAKMARELIRSFGADVRVEDIQGDLQAFCDYIANGSDGKDELTYTEARRRAEAIAQTLVENAVAVDDDGYRQYNDLREYLRTTDIVYGKEYHGDIADFGAFRRGLFGKLNLKTKGQTNIDKVYQEMAYQWPEFFDEQIQSHPTEQLLRIAEVLDGIYNVTEYNPFSNNMEEAVTYAANEIMEGFFDLPQTRATFADRQARKLDDAKAKGHQQAQRIREQDNARMDKLRAQNKEKIQRIRERERARRDAKIEQLKSDYRARDAAGRERRNARETRAKIARHAKELSQKLLRPSDKQHIPENLRQGVAALLEAINLESQYTIDPETGKRKKTDSGLPTKRTEAFLKLKAQYAEIARSGEGLVIDPALFGDAAEGIQGSFDAVIAMGETRLEDMNSRQLETVWQVLKAVEHSVSSAGKVLSRAKYERTSEWAKALQTDSKGRKPKRPLSKKHAALDLETPYTFFSHYGEAGKAVYRMLRDAQDRQQVLVNRIAEAAGKIADSKLVRQLEKNARSYTTQGGEELTLSDAQLMELYLLDKRPQGREHLLGNGVYQPEVKSRHIRRGNKSIRLTPEDLSALTGMLTPEQKKAADKLQALTAGLLADMGNEASMTAYGYKKFVEEHYWPIRSAREEVHSSVEKGGDRPRSIKNTGFAQQLQPQANNAVDIGSVFDTFSDHAAGMTEYAAWLCPMEDAGRLFNHKFTVEDADGKMHTTGENVKNLLDRAGGTGARQYWERLMEDIQNGIRAKSDSPMWDYATKSISGFKGAAVGANVRVILQQPTAFFRAGAVLNPVDMAAALTAGWAKGSGWKKALKWSPIAMRKDNGSFDISSPASMKDTLFDQRSGVQKVNDALSAPAGWADAVTWGVLWNACENQTARTHKELAKGSDAFYRETARTFAEVIDQTQVVDGVLQRSNIMRSSNAVVQQATSFMGEPIMSLNLMMRSWDNFRYEQDKVKRGKAMKVMGRSALALTVTAAVNALAQSLVDGIRDDDRDKKYWERVISAFTGLTGDEESGWDKTKALTAGNFGSNLNIVGQIPFAKDVLSLAQGYSVSRTEAEVVEDLIAAGEMTVEAAQGGKYTPQYAAAETLAAAAKLFGTPVGNIKRDVLGFYRSALIEADNIPAQYELEKAIYNLGSVRNKGRYYDLLYKALELEDMDSYWHIRADLMENMGLDGKSLDSAMKSRYAKQLEKDSGYTLPRQAQDLIGIRESRGDGDSDDSVGFTAKDLAPKEYQRYASERAESYRAVADELEGFSTFRSLDGTVRDKALSAADSLTEKLALEAVSGGAYAADTKWMLWATGGGDAGVSEAEAILFKVAYDMTEGDKDPDTGKTVSGSKKENVLEAAAEMMPWLTDRELDYLMGNYWK